MEAFPNTTVRLRGRGLFEGPRGKGPPSQGGGLQLSSASTVYSALAALLVLTSHGAQKADLTLTEALQ